MVCHHPAAVRFLVVVVLLFGGWSEGFSLPRDGRPAGVTTRRSGERRWAPRVVALTTSHDDEETGNPLSNTPVASSSSSSSKEGVGADAKESSHGDAPVSLPAVDLRSTTISYQYLSYFYLQDEIGLSEETMWKITYEAGSVLGMTAATIRHKVDVLRETMALTDADVRTIIERQPSVLQLSADKNLAPTLLFLLRSLDLGRDDLRRLIVGCPAILTYSRDNLRTKLRFFQHILQFSKAECRQIFVKEPTILRAGVRTGLFPRMRFLLRDVQLSPDDLKSIVLRHPRILLYSLDQNLIPKLVFFCLITLRMETFQVSRLLKAYPEFLGYNLDRHILPISRYFLQDLDYSTPEFTKILLTYPRLVTNSLTKIKHVVGYLRFEQDLSAAQVRRVLYQAPQILGLNTDVSLRGKVRFLRESLHLEQDDDWKRVLSGMPNLLLLSIDRNLQPKISYLLGAFDGNTDVLRAAVVRLPTLLGYSLDKRIIPRMEAIQKAGIDEPGCITVGIPMKEERFQQWLEGRARREEKATAAGPSTMEENSLNGPDETNAPKGDASKSSDDFSRSGRIVHWTRDRRLPR
jgi:hypothetical protein